MSGPALITAPPSPPQAEAVFGDALTLVRDLADRLATDAVERGLLGPAEAPKLWERHLLNCAGPADLLPVGASVVDLGSGAGLPGLVLAVLRRDVSMVLVEPLLRRVTFLQKAVDALALPHVMVCRARAEDLAGVLRADVVVARAVAPLDRLIGWGMPLLHPGGQLVVMKGTKADAELAASGPALRAAGGVAGRVVEVGRVDLLTAGRVVVVERRGATPGAPAVATRRRRSPARGAAH